VALILHSSFYIVVKYLPVSISIPFNGTESEMTCNLYDVPLRNYSLTTHYWTSHYYWSEVIWRINVYLPIPQ